MSCIDYVEFYSSIASSVLILFSISIGVAIILWQQRSEKNELIEQQLEYLTSLIDEYMEINYEAREVRFMTRSRNLELTEMIKNVIQKYNNWKSIDYETNKWKYNDEEYKSFLIALYSLQDRLYWVLINKLGKIERKDIYNNNYKYRIYMQDYQWFMEIVYPYLNKVEGIYTSLFSVIEDNKKYWSQKYGDSERRKSELSYNCEYWDKLLEIRSKSIDINENMKNNYQKNLLSSIIDSSSSIKWIKASSILIILFGFIIPIYMIQPNKFGFLQIDHVFYITVIAISVSVICTYKSYNKRYMYGMIPLELMIEDLKNHEKDGFRAKAAHKLGEISDRRAIKPLEEALKIDDSGVVRVTAMGALVKLGKKKYFGQIIQALEDEDSKVRSRALNILGDIRDPRAVDSIVKILETDAVQVVRLSAAHALGKIGDSRAKEPLKNCAKNDNSDLVKKAAIDMLNIIDFCE